MQKVLAFVFPLIVALLLTGFIPAQQQTFDARLQLQHIKVASAAELHALFEQLDYGWPPQADTQIPAIEVLTLPGDLSKVQNMKRKKSLFFRALLPIVLAENEKVAELRHHIIQMISKGVTQLDKAERRWLDVVASQYKIKGNLDQVWAQQKLLRRVDTVPPPLVLAQAANESAWGTSRFARQGNNLFGQWTYRQSEGLVPQGRPVGATYAVRAFPSLAVSVRAYIQNINTNPAYIKLRLLRQQMRDSNMPLDSHVLATGLEAYSARGEDYVVELQTMMRNNRLPKLLHSVSLNRGS
jgi:Bax protein